MTDFLFLCRFNRYGVLKFDIQNRLWQCSPRVIALFVNAYEQLNPCFHEKISLIYCEYRRDCTWNSFPLSSLKNLSKNETKIIGELYNLKSERDFLTLFHLRSCYTCNYKMNTTGVMTKVNCKFWFILILEKKKI